MNLGPAGRLEPITQSESRRALPGAARRQTGRPTPLAWFGMSLPQAVVTAQQHRSHTTDHAGGGVTVCQLTISEGYHCQWYPSEWCLNVTPVPTKVAVTVGWASRVLITQNPRRWGGRLGFGESEGRLDQGASRKFRAMSNRDAIRPSVRWRRPEAQAPVSVAPPTALGRKPERYR